MMFHRRIFLSFKGVYLLMAMLINTCEPVVYPVADTCRDMMILFWNEAQEENPSPFSVTAGKSVVKAGEKISATISSVDGTPYKAFLLQARNNNGESFGDFKSDHNIGVYSCHTGQFDMAANGDFRRKVKNVVYWVSPKNLCGNVTVRFVLTAMKEKNECWTGIKSNKFTIIGNATCSEVNQTGKYFRFFSLPIFLRWPWPW